MDLDEVRSFLAVYEARSFAAAAATLGWPRATLRRRVDALEARLGAALFVRTALGAEPTPLARELAPRGRELLHSARAMLRIARHADGDLRGQLHVGVPPGLPPSLTGVVLAALRHAVPDVQVVATIVAPPLGPAISDLDLDLLLFQGEADLGDGWQVVTPIHVRRRLVASGALLDAVGRPREPADLTRFALLVQGTWSDAPTTLPMLDGSSVSVTPALVHPDVHLLHQLAAAGSGIAFVPDAEVDERADGVAPVEVVLDDIIGDVVPVSIAVPTVLVAVPRVRALLELATQLLRGV
ncbi:MAG: LysR family transcriptional regulator [Myxococcales bacterium]|nr:LysR family transcriptional regulator [Myxococcales bacterium]